MTIERQDELDAMRAAGAVVARTLAAMRAAVRPGITTRALDDIALGEFERSGARSAPALVYGFPGATCISVNDEIVHGIPGDRRLAPGDVVKLDVTAEKDGFMADAALTVVLAPQAPRARRLASCAQQAFRRGAAAARAGARVSDIGRAVEREVDRHGFRVVRELAGHGIGRTIHELPTVPNYDDPRSDERLEEGMVLTIEPLIADGKPATLLDRDGWTVRTRDGSLAAHHEHTLVITKGAPLVITGAG